MFTICSVSIKLELMWLNKPSRLRHWKKAPDPIEEKLMFSLSLKRILPCWSRFGTVSCVSARYHRKDQQTCVVEIPIDGQVGLDCVVLLLADEEVDHDRLAVLLVLLAFVDLG